MALSTSQQTTASLSNHILTYHVRPPPTIAMICKKKHIITKHHNCICQDFEKMAKTVYIYCFIFCSQSSFKSATNCCQMERQIQQDAWGSVHIACVSPQCLHENCLQMLEKGLWPPSNSPKFEWNGYIWKQCMKLF